MTTDLKQLEYNKLMQSGLRELSTTDLLIDGVLGAKSLAAFKKFGDIIGYKFDKEPTSISGPLADKVHEFSCSRYATDADFVRMAKSLAVPESYLRAVAEVETMGNAYLVDGRCTILFERHKFNTYLTAATHADKEVSARVAKVLGITETAPATVMAKLREKYPNICSVTAGGYVGKAGEYPRIDQAKLFDLESAYRSASWGRFQIMGFNHKLAGYNSAVEMALDYERSEVAQFESLVKFIQNQPNLLKALRARDFATFASGYNGSAYKINKYDTRMDAAEVKWAKALAA